MSGERKRGREIVGVSNLMRCNKRKRGVVYRIPWDF